jgi:hypothetical protein
MHPNPAPNVILPQISAPNSNPEQEKEVTLNTSKL